MNPISGSTTEQKENRKRQRSGMAFFPIQKKEVNMGFSLAWGQVVASREPLQELLDGTDQAGVQAEQPKQNPPQTAE